jgi:hypothetical protein
MRRLKAAFLASALLLAPALLPLSAGAATPPHTTLGIIPGSWAVDASFRLTVHVVKMVDFWIDRLSDELERARRSKLPPPIPPTLIVPMPESEPTVVPAPGSPPATPQEK